jgi:predicted nicotinamide N-methyase
MKTRTSGSERTHPAAAAATEYTGPVAVAVFRFAGQVIRLVRPAEPDRLLDDPGVAAWNRRDDYMPYWAYLWPAAYLLAETVAREPWPERPEPGPIEALEIGCGLGLAGLVGVARGLRVVFSDYDQAPLDFVIRSAAENGFDPAWFATRLLDWRNLPAERFPVILGSDVLYEAWLVPLVANLLATMLAPGGLGLIATPFRVSAQGFPAAVESCGLTCRTEPVTAQSEDGLSIQGTVYRVTRSGSGVDSHGWEKGPQVWAIV